MQPQLFTLKGANGFEAVITNFGARIQSLFVPAKGGKKVDVEFGFDTVEEYYADCKPTDFGALIGQYGNRIAGGKFTLDGVEYTLPINNGPNCLHGGPRSWEYRFFDVKAVSDTSLTLELVSPDGDNGFPGEQVLRVTYTVAGTSLDICYEAVTSAPTVINVTNHSYFNLSGDPAYRAEGYVLGINASGYLPVDENMIPLGHVAPVQGTPFDFRTPHLVGDHIDDADIQLQIARGYDHCYVLDTKGNIEAPASTVLCPESGVKLTVYTTEPGAQLYTSNWLEVEGGKGGAYYGLRTAICIETQHYPDSPNQPQFPSTVLRPGETLSTRTIFAFSVEE